MQEGTGTVCTAICLCRLPACMPFPERLGACLSRDCGDCLGQLCTIHASRCPSTDLYPEGFLCAISILQSARQLRFVRSPLRLLWIAWSLTLTHRTGRPAGIESSAGWCLPTSMCACCLHATCKSCLILPSTPPCEHSSAKSKDKHWQVTGKTLDICCQVLKRVREEAVRRDAGIIFLGTRQSSSCTHSKQAISRCEIAVFCR